MKIYTDDFRMQRKPSRATAKSTLFTVSKNEWNTKEDTGKSLKNALDILQYANCILAYVDCKLSKQRIQTFHEKQINNYLLHFLEHSSASM